MTFNKRMHPRNKYRSPPNFRMLAIEFEEFREHAVQDLSGKISIDFKNAAALRALTRVLLKKDWDLDVIIPPDRLVPTLPLRLNYILWLEDLLQSVGYDVTNKIVYGIDIGTGAACVYPLLAAKKNGWHMLATEVDEESAQHAAENVKRNNLDSLIKVQKVTGETLLKEAIEKSINQGDSTSSEVTYDFTMCNPPFFTNEDDMENSSSGRSPLRPRKPPRNAHTGSLHEVVIEGGEVGFVSRMIEEGKQLQNKIRIYTTMVGHKSSVSRITKVLNEAGVTNVIRTEFCQGRTMRWGVAWSYTLDLTPAKSVSHITKKEKPRAPLHYVVPENCGSKAFDVAQQVLHILDSISVKHELLEMKINSMTYQVTAYKNTWSNQRRKRREERRLQEQAKSGNESESQTLQDSTNQVELTENSEEKRKHSDESENPAAKRIKTDEPDAASSSNSVKINETGPPLLVMTIVVRGGNEDSDDETSQKSSIVLEVNWVEGTGGRELAHQVFQYIKNHLRPTDETKEPLLQS